MRLFLLLAVLCLALGAWVRHETDIGASPPEMATTERSGRAPDAPDMQLPHIATPNLDRFAEILQRPLFDPSRRPDVQGEGAADRNPPALADVELKGITITPDGRRALLSKGRAAPYLIVTEGDDVNGWTVKTIGNDSIVLGSVGGTVTIELKSPPPPPGPGNRPRREPRREPPKP